jgi:hypothetical protein
MALVVLFALVGGWIALAGVAYVARAIDRRLPDAGMRAHRLGTVQRFSGFDPRPELRHRRARIAREIRQLQSHKRHLDRRLEDTRPVPARPTSIADARRAG